MTSNNSSRHIQCLAERARSYKDGLITAREFLSQVVLSASDLLSETEEGEYWPPDVVALANALVNVDGKAGDTP